MTKKDLIAPIAIISLSVIFAIISLAVFLTNGKSAFWISKKFKIGALLLTFTTIMACKPRVTCYEPAPQNWITLDSVNWETDEVVLDSSDNQKITGRISGSTDSVYSYNLLDSTRNIILYENLLTLDGDFNDYDEKFEIPVVNLVNTGRYLLQFYKKSKEYQIDENFVYSFSIKIIK